MSDSPLTDSSIPVFNFLDLDSEEEAREEARPILGRMPDVAMQGFTGS